MTLAEGSGRLSAERVSAKRKTGRKRKRIHELSRQRPTFGEFCHLYGDARIHPEKFKEYVRTSKAAASAL
jgi:hypothetical protein